MISVRSFESFCDLGPWQKKLKNCTIFFHSDYWFCHLLVGQRLRFDDKTEWHHGRFASKQEVRCRTGTNPRVSGLGLGRKREFQLCMAMVNSLEDFQSVKAWLWEVHECNFLFGVYANLLRHKPLSDPMWSVVVVNESFG